MGQEDCGNPSFPGWSALAREAAAVLRLAGKSMMREFFVRDTHSAGDSRRQETVFFLPGFLMPAWLYRGVCSEMEEMAGGALRFYIPRAGTWDMPSDRRSYYEAVGILKRECMKFRPQVVVGHSLGGVQAIELLAAHSFIKRVIAVASPLYGTPWRLMKRAAQRFLKIDPDDLPQDLFLLREHVLLVADRIVTLYHADDWLAPPERCYIPGAKNVIVLKRISSVHAGMILSREVRECVINFTRETLGDFKRSSTSSFAASFT